MANIEIDGKKLEVREGAMLIEAADEAGINIPRFCYHKKLSIAANCRMCLIEVEKVGKALPACATPVTDGMKIFTRSPKAIAAQKGVMEFLLINHPLDCPICDQGGECELQDVAMGYGGDVSTYTEQKRVVEDKDFGPLISGEMTRCIHCTRCVRFGEEIAGIKEMGATGRGEHMEIGTYVKMSLHSEMSGNIIDLCPVGALTSKPFRFKARAWEVSQRDTIAPHDCLGSNLHVHSFRNEVVRVVPRENEEINETWLSDRDRFSYEGLNSNERMTSPMIKFDGEWEKTDWDTALNAVVDGLTIITKGKGADQLGAIASPTNTVEELYLLQKLMRSVGSDNVDHRIGQVDFSDENESPIFPWLGQSISDLEKNDACLLIGSNIRRDQPIAGHRIRKAAQNGANIMCVNALDYDFNFPVTAKKIISPAKMLTELTGILKALSSSLPKGLDSLASNIEVDDTHKTIANLLKESASSTILLGLDAIGHAQFSGLRAIAGQIAQLTDSKLGYLPKGGNGAGAWLAGAVPHRGVAANKSTKKPGMNISAMLKEQLAGYILLGIEPEVDCAESKQALEAMKNAQFVVSLNSFANDSVKEYADVILPISPFTETSGTFVNAEGRWQSFEGIVEPRGETRPAWKILRVMGNLFGFDDFEYISSQEIRDELKTKIGDITPNNDMAWACPKSLNGEAEGIESIADHPMYATDCLLRRAESLQAVSETYHSAIRINQTEASNFGLNDGEPATARKDGFEVTLPVIIDNRVPDEGVLLPSDLLGAVMYGSGSAGVTLSRLIPTLTNEVV
jgi:NADH-quinone oxidoreductase subunit G